MVAGSYSGGKTISIPKGILCGAAYSLITTMMLCAVTAYAVNKSYLQEKDIGYVIMLLLIVASYVGARKSYHKINRQKLKISLISGLLYMLQLLMITALFFGGQYRAVPETALLILCGSVLAAMRGNPVKKRKHSQKIKYRHR